MTGRVERHGHAAGEQLSLACPQCRVVLDRADAAIVCRACGQRYDCRGGIHRFLPPTESDETRRFYRQYKAVRERDGARSYRDVDYRRLPSVAPDHPRANEWQIRSESFESLCHAIGCASDGSESCTHRVADLGAGNGWLSYRLAQLGCQVVAIDRLDDDRDGLGACRHYDRMFLRAQADFDQLPLVDGGVDVVVLNGSLHYSPRPEQTLAEARRVLAPGGVLFVMDSPMFGRDADGEAMVHAQLVSFARDYGVTDAVRPGVGFLTFERLRSATERLGLRGQFLPSRGPLGWRIRRALGRIRLRRAPASFGVWVAQ